MQSIVDNIFRCNAQGQRMHIDQNNLVIYFGYSLALAKQNNI